MRVIGAVVDGGSLEVDGWLCCVRIEEEELVIHITEEPERVGRAAAENTDRVGDVETALQEEGEVMLTSTELRIKGKSKND